MRAGFGCLVGAAAFCDTTQHSTWLGWQAFGGVAFILSGKKASFPLGCQRRFGGLSDADVHIGFSRGDTTDGNSCIQGERVMMRCGLHTWLLSVQLCPVNETYLACSAINEMGDARRCVVPPGPDEDGAITCHGHRTHNAANPNPAQQTLTPWSHSEASRRGWCGSLRHSL